jgi:farnesyl diphosphate synthase
MSSLSISVVAVAVSCGALHHFNQPVVTALLADPVAFLGDPEKMSAGLLIASVTWLLIALAARSSSREKAVPAASSSSSSITSSVIYPLDEVERESTEKDQFMVMFSHLKNEFTSHMANTYGMPAEACEWVDKMVEYNVLGGKLNRGLTVLAVQKTLKQAREQGKDKAKDKAKKDVTLTSLETAKASVLGWAIEWLQAFFLVADDVMDDSETRRGNPCWYKQPHVGMIAINDSFLLESFVFTVLKSHFGNEKYYSRLLHLFIDVIQQTELGQLLDLTSQIQGGPVDLNRFTLERYKLIVKFKTMYYTFYLPIAIGMITSGVEDEAAYDLAKTICGTMGEYFQVQDDYLDCYGDIKTIGKVGTDIQDNKCSWLVVKALEHANEKQRKTLEQNYGKWEAAKVAKVKAVYAELEMEKMFKDYEEESYKSIQDSLEKVTLMPKEVFAIMLKKIYKRKS